MTLIVPLRTDGHGASCSSGLLPGIPGLPSDNNIITGGPTENKTYSQTSWSNCCAHHEVTLHLSCYPWCEIPDEYVTKGDVGATSSAMRDCLSLISITTIKLSGASTNAVGPSLTSVLTVEMALAYLLQ